jgi:hypothetical protein
VVKKKLNDKTSMITSDFELLKLDSVATLTDDQMFIRDILIAGINVERQYLRQMGVINKSEQDRVIRANFGFILKQVQDELVTPVLKLRDSKKQIFARRDVEKVMSDRKIKFELDQTGIDLSLQV